ncbi:hypothetical protein HU200_056372 [Digitaria exilis]|uniref:NAD-dependent epimerase/dehydratase domain-containing protein n=1 Tax=Digitaria exilis TaxID=1010633 RepID=A0A835AJ06_9POAL|nr:hypothetical protein HU200_056372 [Digitaria exilis]
MTGAGKVVCVTGASGYIASWIVKLLLARGYTVRATVRNIADPKKTLHLRALDGAKDRLQFFQASLLEEGSFDAAVDGCETVFHTASPFYHNVKDPKVELLDPAVQGTLNVLGSCKKASIRKVVVTSSVAAVAYNRKPKTPEVIVDETWFSDSQILEKNQQWYALSKTLAEEAAWKFSRDNGFEIVRINPAMVIGPLLQPTLNTSAEAILKLITGSSSMYPNLSFGWANVKDVALAHILAYEVPSANGRYCVVERVVHYSEIVNIIRKMYPAIPFPAKCANDKPFDPTYQVSKEKIRSLGIELMPVETSIKETIESLKDKGFAELLDPAVKGTLNVLGSCKKASIRKVIVTSSNAAVAYNEKPKTPEVIVGETWFSDPQFCEKNQPTLNTSAEAILKLITGSSSTYPNVSSGWVNVKDVALAHILAYEVPSANGRYFMVERVAHYSELVNIIRKMYPTIPFPAK